MSQLATRSTVRLIKPNRNRKIIMNKLFQFYQQRQVVIRSTKKTLIQRTLEFHLKLFLPYTLIFKKKSKVNF